MNLVDYSFSRPWPAQLKAAGAEGVLRYSSLDPAKTITVAEASVLHALDLPFGLVEEDGAGDFTAGANAGAAKAKITAPLLAELTRAELWAPDRPVHAAVDENLPRALYQITWEGIHAYATALGRPDACYGPRPFLYWLEQQHGVRYLWELGSSSFNTGPEPTSKTIQQLTAVPPGCKPLAGVDWDLALKADWGQFPAPVPAKDARAAVVSWARWGVAHRGAAGGINYAEVRPIPLTNHLPLTTDCSGFVTLCYYLAGCPDPNGLGYSGGATPPYEWTGSLVAHGHEVAPLAALPGDLVVYGPGSGVHVAIVVEGGADPLTVSHGEEGDPSLVRVSAGCPTTGYMNGRPFARFFRYDTTLAFPGHVPSAPHPSPLPTTEDEIPMFITSNPSNPAAEFLVSGSRRAPIGNGDKRAALLAQGVKVLPTPLTVAEFNALVPVAWGTL